MSKLTLPALSVFFPKYVLIEAGFLFAFNPPFLYWFVNNGALVIIISTTEKNLNQSINPSMHRGAG
jgi:hypothetical protein